jgi:6-phosphogluconolactonase (cycloisomerase 2 family)
MKRTTHWIAIALGVLFFAACKKDDHGHDDDLPGHVFIVSNQVKANMVLDYTRATNGMLMFNRSWSTGGTGTGTGLGSQGAVVLADDGILLAVNAGSNSIASLKITGNEVKLISTENSGGEMPISIAQYGHLVFVLNAGGAGNISGFALNTDGKLYAIPNSTRPLSAANVEPAQISFVNDGKVLAITEKMSNKITTYTVSNMGVPGTMHTINSANSTPFGFGVGRNGYIFVSEAAGGAPTASTLSSYHISDNGVITLKQGPVAAGQTAACWVVINKNGKYVYATNTGSNNISSFNINNSGSLSVLNAVAAPSDMSPIDADMSSNAKYLYVLNAMSNSITAYSAAGDGGLSKMQTVTGLPGGASGLAAR